MNKSQKDQPHSIIVIDDNPAIHEDFNKVLGVTYSADEALDQAHTALFDEPINRPEAAQFAIDFAFQGKAGLEMVQTALQEGRPYMLAFVDIRMPPGWDGVETIQNLWRAQPHLQVVICTAYSDYSWDALQQKLGDTDNLLILRKPFDNIEVLQMAKTLTRKWIATREAARGMAELDRLVQERTRALEEENRIRRQAEAALRESEELYRTVFERSPLGIATCSPDGRFLTANPAFCAMLEYTEQELREVNVADVSLEEEFASERCEVDRIKTDTLSGITIEKRYRTKSGRIVWGKLGVSIVSDADGNTQYAIGAVVDITQRKRMEDALRESERRLRLALEAAKQGLYDLNIVTGEWKVSTEYATMLGYEPDGFLETQSAWLERMHPEDRDRVTEKFHAFLRGDLPRFEAEFRQKTMSQKWKWILSLGQIVSWDAEGKPLRMLGTHTDITERQQAEEYRREMEQQMQQAQRLESLGVLAGGIAHDFNNLLAAIMGNASLAVLQLPPTSPAVESLQEIDMASHRAADLCRQMLAYAGKSTIRTQSVHLSELIQEMVNLLHSSISKKANLHLELNPNLPTVNGDATQLRQIVMNLLTNASEALGDNVGSIHIATGCEEFSIEYLQKKCPDESLAGGRYVWMEVSDTGCGMDAETQQLIFDPFFTTKFLGRGLGLSATRGIVRSHLGFLTLCSDLGKGSTFRIHIPAETQSRAINEPSSKLQSNWKGSGLVLLVDDEEKIRIIGKKMLTQLGFEVLTANDGKEGIKVYGEHAGKIVLVVLDFTMPRMNGEETFQGLRLINPQVRVLLTSGYAETEMEPRFEGKGLAGFLQKPFTFHEMQHKIRCILVSPGA